MTLPLATQAPADGPAPLRRDACAALYAQYAARIAPHRGLDRMLVSFQANRRAELYCWYTYREGFSEALVTLLLDTLGGRAGRLLDPFAGVGTALFAGSSLGWRTTGIELLPLGVGAIRARQVAYSVEAARIESLVGTLAGLNLADYYDPAYVLPPLPIARGAYPASEEVALVGLRAYCHRCIADDALRTVLLYAALCVLEDISFTRKDGQFLRWSAASGRSRARQPFHKERILPLREALPHRLRQLATTLSVRPEQLYLFGDGPLPYAARPPIEILQGSCLDLLPRFPAGGFECVMTSPAYGNRYDYTRIYALELAFLGCDGERVKQLRQAMLSCTVENREKRAALEHLYQTLGRERDFRRVEEVYRAQEALAEVVANLEARRTDHLLNNGGIVRLIRNYFYELCFVIHELERLLTPGGLVIMVNDNVRYAGVEVPTDLLLGAMAESFGLEVRHIWILDHGKGNSSQQMGRYGREELRKCVYVWQKR